MKELSKIKPDLKYFLKEYLKERPLFLSLIRAKEAFLFQKYMPLKKAALDFGCGDGYFAKITLANKSKIQKPKSKEAVKIDIGLDLQESRIEEARKQNIYKKLVTYDGRKIPYPDGSFKTVISNCVLEHIPDLKNSLKEIYRILKPKGLFITSVATDNWEEYLFGSLLLGDLYKKWMRQKQVHINLYSEKKWTEVFESVGFEVIEKTGYLHKNAVRWIDILHYLSLSSLFTYKLFNRWVLFPQKNWYFLYDILEKTIKDDLPAKKGGNIFFALKK
jgi:ubiquinone/menaquinone biosynthesis C-methylase UbiE